MNRQQMIERTLLWDQIAAAARAKSTALREQLTADATAELAEQGTAPTWRLPDIGTVTLPVSTETVYVADEAALLAWVKAFPADPGDVIETIERIKPWYVNDLLRLVRVVDGNVIDEDGTVVPGLAVRPGGQPKSLSFRPTAAAREVLAAGAGALVDEVERRLVAPIVLDGSDAA